MSTMTEAIETTLAARELGEKVAGAREEQRAVAHRIAHDLITYNGKYELAQMGPKFAELLEQLKGASVTFTPLADLITSLRADLVSAAAVAAQLQAEKELLQSRLTTADDNAALLRAEFERVGSEIAAERDAANERVRALTGELVAVKQDKEDYRACVPTDDQMVILRADYERLIASLPVRPRLSVVETPSGASTPQPPSET